MAVELNTLPSNNINNIDTNFQRVEVALQDAVSRSGNGPNQFTADVDLNSNNLLNVYRIDVQEFYMDGQPIASIPGFEAIVEVAPYIITVANISDDVEAVADNAFNINVVSNNIGSINNVSTNISSVVTVAGNIGSVNTVAANVVNINTVVSNLPAILDAPTQATNAANSASAAATSASNAATSAANAAAAVVPAIIGYTTKTVPVDADTFGYVQASNNTGRKFTWANLKNALISANIFATPWTELAAVATTSGATIDFTSIPAGVTDIEVWFAGVSMSGSSHLNVQIGTGGTPTATGYMSGSAVASADGVRVNSSSGFIAYSNSAVIAFNGIMQFHRLTGNTWVASHTLFQGNANTTAVGGGSVTLAGALDIVRLVASGTFDAGSVQVRYK